MKESDLAVERFDEQLVEGFSFSFDFDSAKFNRFLAKAGMGLDVVEEQVLYELGCGELVDDSFIINNTGALFFSREPQKFVRQSYITCARYQGNSMVSVVDRKDLQGDLLSLVDEAEAFVKRHTRLAYKFDGFKRIDVEEYPYLAIREAIINAVCHRDYFSQNNVFVNVFDDSVEVISPGSIPNNLSLKEVEGKSNPRNFTILGLFKKAGEIEKLGTGLKRMNELMMAHGLKKPEYEAGKLFFKVTFRGPGENILGLVKPSNELDLRELGLNERQVKALNKIQFKKLITSSEYETLLGTTHKTAQRDLNELVEKGFLKKEGSKKSVKFHMG